MLAQLCCSLGCCLCRPLKLKVVEYVPARTALQSPKMKQIQALRLVHSTEEGAMQGFKQYLMGFRGVGKPTSQPKLAVVKTQSYSILLGCQDGDESATSGLSCWVM